MLFRSGILKVVREINKESMITFGVNEVQMRIIDPVQAIMVDITIDKKFFDSFSKYSSFRELEKLESLIGKTVGVEAYKIVIVPMITPWRFVPEDILYHDDGNILSLKKTYPDYFEAMKREADDYVAVRVCIIGDRGLIYKNSELIHKLIKNI